MTAANDKQVATIDVDENATVFIKMKNKDTNSTSVFLAQINSKPETLNNSKTQNSNFQTTYTWDYSSQFSSGLKDGMYDAEITAQDKAGNMSTTYEAGTIQIDRTPPTIYAQAAVPYVLANTGSNPYTTTLSYRLSEDASELTVKVYHESTGQLVKTFANAPASISAENKITWNAAAAGSLPTGSYQLSVPSVI